MALSTSSRKTYSTGQLRFSNFCKQLHVPPYPLQETTLRLFASFLARTLSFQTTQTHLAAIRFHHIELGFPCNFPNMQLLRLLLRGIKRANGERATLPRQPITVIVLKCLKTQLGNSSLPVHDQHMLWAAFTTAFFGFLRSSEFCCPYQNTYNPSSTLLTSDLKFSSSTVTIYLKVSKADPFRNGINICLAASGKSVCPLRALRNHIDNYPGYVGPVFHFADGSFLTRHRLSTSLGDLLRSTPYSGMNYTSHSFRIGAATAAAAADVPDWLIKVLGRWSSDCYQRYIRTPSSVIQRIPGLLASPPPITKS